MTGAEGIRLREGGFINKSLFALGNVINKLSEGEKYDSLDNIYLLFLFWTLSAFFFTMDS